MKDAPTTDDGAAKRAHGRAWPILQIVAGIVLFVAFDTAVFASGLYLRWVSPDSGLGNLFYAMRFTAKSPAVQGGMIVLGDSRMAEGFSARLASEEGQRLGASHAFFNSAVPGTTPRVWYYMLRHYRDLGVRPAAVVLMAESFRDAPSGAAADRLSDIAYVHPYVGWKDIATFPLSYLTTPRRIEALEAVLFKGWLFQGDIEDFIRQPLKRIKVVELWRKHGGEWIDGYPGHDESLAGLTLNLATGDIGWPPGPETLPRAVRDYVADFEKNRGDPRGTIDAARYNRDWYGATAELCHEMGAKLIVFRLPRGPLHYLAAPQGEPRGALTELAAAGDAVLIDENMFDDLEHPGFFFDQLHMNRAGRENFSPRLARETLRLLAP
jgi:hypothetical protein